MYPKDEWDNDFKLWVIGTSYCHSRKFKTDQETYLWFQVLKMHKKMLLKLMNKCLPCK